MSASQYDVMAPISPERMEQIISRQKSYESTRYRLAPDVKRIWFYLTAPYSCIAYICEIDHITPMESRFSCTLKSIWRMRKSVELREMKERYGIKVAPRGLVYVPTCIVDAHPWRDQQCLWTLERNPRTTVPIASSKPTLKRKLTRSVEEADLMDGVHHKLLKVHHAPQLTQTFSDDKMDVDP
ncbi:hypothetical protein VNI00_008522 [Paramarasmius palmivorus]|uniref:Uncharacterized protein n=1 Tax=Paramarasmius palmivorus TaxID=297713 RepID=A0AAW0CX88_9AGAR